MIYNKNWIVFDTPEEYLEFFDNIPEEKWCVGDFIRGYTGQMCAIGLLTGGEGDMGIGPWHPFRHMFGEGVRNAASINNGDSVNEQLGDTPKERVINALILKCAGLWEEACGDRT